MDIESLENLLKKRRYTEPEEIKLIREYVHEKYKVIPGFKIAGNKIIINVPSAALAGVLQPDLHNLQKKLRTKKQLLIRISR